MKLPIRWMLMSAVCFAANGVSDAGEPPHDPVYQPLDADIAFEHYVELQQIADALRTENAAALIDLSLQLAEAERILLRGHNSKLTSSELLLKAAQLAAKNNDTDSLARLSMFAEKLEDKGMLTRIKAATKLSADSRVEQPEVSISIRGTDIDSLIDLKDWMDFISGLESTGDRASLVAVLESIDASERFSDSQKTALKIQADDSLKAIGNSDPDGLLTKLTSTGRGWNPRKTIGEIAEGDFVGAISGADFRIEQNNTDFSGNSGKHWKMVYTLKNETPYHISVEFAPSGNVSPLPPGKKITCRSRASAWGSEKTGVKYTYPQVRAKASNGKNWLRTISRDGEDYRIIRRADGSIQIVP
ncbi:MAG: hypothetical protein KDB01_06715 [Planctomycetaceae bacterium]|jgi:hypothetical protein|nr:hypothetical protein [Planctomycetaceae bacterium]